MNRTSLAVLALTALVTSAPADAASIFEDLDPTPAMLRFDPSARFQAMGDAAGAVFWGTDRGDWANPALLGLASGIQFQAATEDLAVLRFRAHREVLGWSGIGISLSGRPFGEQKVSGSVDVIGPGGEIDHFELEEKISAWGAGASLSGLAASIAGVRNRRVPAWTQFADLAFGAAHKDESLLDVQAWDWGLLARAGTPFGGADSRGWRGRIESAYGYSVQNNGDHTWPSHRHSTALRVTLDTPWDPAPSWIARGLEPLLSLGGAWDRVFVTTQDGARKWDDTRIGMELGLANMAFVRFGQGPNGSPSPSGYGFALPIGRLASLHYDHARIPGASGFPDLEIEGWSVWMDPVAIAQALR